jgi:hypothetical protein
MYYKDEFGKLVGIQTTMSNKHAKDVSTFKDCIMRLGQIKKTPH